MKIQFIYNFPFNLIARKYLTVITSLPRCIDLWNCFLTRPVDRLVPLSHHAQSWRAGKNAAILLPLSLLLLSLSLSVEQCAADFLGFCADLKKVTT